MQFVIFVILSQLLIIGLSVASCVYLFENMQKVLTLIFTPKPQVPPPPPLYLPYERCIALFSRHITKTLQRVFITHILPHISNADGKIMLLSPNDIKYEQFILSVTLQVIEGMDAYLKSSLYFYYNVKGADIDDAGMQCLTKTMTDQIIAELDKKIIQNAEYIEKNGPSTYPYIKAINELAGKLHKATGKPGESLKAPDGSDVTFD